jgi:acyl-CoA synthetase (AMP-forming)/AMP-acid ligase II
MPNGIATLRILLGAMYGGYCVNPVNLLSSAEQMRYVLDHSDTAMVFASPDWAPKVREIVKDVSRPIEVVEVDPMTPRHPGRWLFARAPASSSRAPQRGDGLGSMHWPS